MCYKLLHIYSNNFLIQCTHHANKAKNNNGEDNDDNSNNVIKYCAKHCHGFETWNMWIWKGGKNKRIANHWPDSVVNSTHTNRKNYFENES